MRFLLFRKKVKKFLSKFPNTYNYIFIPFLLERKYIFLSNFFKSYGVTKVKRVPSLIVSLTSFPKRIDKVYLTIETILRQTEKPDYIYLWLSKEEFPKLKKELPKKLLEQEKRGLTIKFCRRNIKSYKKLIYTLKENPQANIVTVDDDMFYNKNTIKLIFLKHKQYPNEVIGLRASKMKLKNKNELEKYNLWESCKKEQSGLFVFPTGGSGVLYPKKSLHREVFNEKIFMQLAPYADDVWFKAMSLLNNIKSRKITNKILKMRIINLTQSSALHSENLGKNLNDIQLKKVFKRYDLYKILNK